MMALVSELAVRTRYSTFGRWCGKVSAVLDCAIPIAIVIVLVASTASMALGYF
jgi:hypothetical protein